MLSVTSFMPIKQQDRKTFFYFDGNLRCVLLYSITIYGCFYCTISLIKWDIPVLFPNQPVNLIGGPVALRE